MITLQERAYKALPLSIRRYIMNNPEKYPEYSHVLLNKRYDLLKKYKNKINLNPNEIRLMLTIVKIYDFIIKNPPVGSSNYHTINSWEKFYKIYDVNNEFDYETYEGRWPKSFWLLYYTYLISYRKYYNLEEGTPGKDKEYALPFNRIKDNFSTFIYKQYKHLDKNVTLEKFEHWGY